MREKLTITIESDEININEALGYISANLGDGESGKSVTSGSVEISTRKNTVTTNIKWKLTKEDTEI